MSGRHQIQTLGICRALGGNRKPQTSIPTPVTASEPQTKIMAFTRIPGPGVTMRPRDKESIHYSLFLTLFSSAQPSPQHMNFSASVLPPTFSSPHPLISSSCTYHDGSQLPGLVLDCAPDRPRAQKGAVSTPNSLRPKSAEYPVVDYVPFLF